jgi:signal transduction histidine kinase
MFFGSVYKDDQGVLGIVIVARDITDQKKSETELMKLKYLRNSPQELPKKKK